MSSLSGDGPHCPGCRGYTKGWEHVCPGLAVPVPGGMRELVSAEIAAYEYDRELGNPGSLADRIARVLARSGLLIEPHPPEPS